MQVLAIAGKVMTSSSTATVPLYVRAGMMPMGL